MKVTKVKDYAEDESTTTLQVISAVTNEGCIISEREYEYEEEDENSRDFGKTLNGTEITMSVPCIDTEAQVYRTLEDLAAETDSESVEVPVLSTDDAELLDEISFEDNPADDALEQSLLKD